MSQMSNLLSKLENESKGICLTIEGFLEDRLNLSESSHKTAKIALKEIEYYMIQKSACIDCKSQYVGNGAIFITTHTAFQKSKCRISGKIGFYEMPLERSYEIDSNHDLFIVDKLLKKRK